MLRPATPLTILFFVAFVLLLLATISTPIVKTIPLASLNQVNLGVFGYCTPKECSKIKIGYSVDAQTLFGDASDNSDFSLPPGARSSLSSILIVHPVAALLTLICFLMAAAAHLHTPSHSPRYLIAILILSIPALLVSLLAFLVDILLFVPHLAWGGWIVLASTILILASGIVTCAMRRTLVSRKERKRRIAENTEMNGQSFYATQTPIPQGIRADSPPPLSSSGVAGQPDKLPSFTTFEKKSTEEDRIPLNTRTPSNKTLPSMPGSQGPSVTHNGYERYGAPPRGGPIAMRGGGGYGGPNDEYGSDIPTTNAFGPAPPMGIKRDRSDPPMRRQYSDEAIGGYGSRGGRGRGGYPPRGYGRGGPYGPGRGGYGRGPMGPPPGRGPPPGYGNSFAQGRPGQYDGPNSGPAAYGRSPSAPNYGRMQAPPSPSYGRGGYGRQSPGLSSAPGGYVRGPPSRGPPSDPGGYAYDRREAYQEPPSQSHRQPSPPSPPPLIHPPDIGMIGRAVEMDAQHGSPSRSPAPPLANPNELRDTDSDVHGLDGMQRQPKKRESPMSMTSIYSANETYVPPRAAWKGNPSSRGLDQSSNSTTPTPTNNIPPVLVDNPIELPVQNTLRKPRSNTGPSQPTTHTRNQSSDQYYEDIDPRFAQPSPQPILDIRNPTQATESSVTVPSALIPGIAASPQPIVEHSGEIVDPTSSYEDIPDGQLSPASDHSNMTSISQRGINPNWQPSEQQGRLGMPGRRPVQQQKDMLLDSNPNFGLPGRTGGTNGRSAMQIPPPTQHGQAF